MDSRFTLEKYAGPQTRHVCPACKKKGEFVRYIDTEGIYTFPNHVGRCNRESTCGYHYPYTQYIRERGVNFGGGKDFSPTSPKPLPQKPIEYFDESTMLATMKAYDRNSFVVNVLRAIFNENQISNIINRYRLGTTKSSAVVFWQIDVLGRGRYGKVMHFKPDLHRDKSKPPKGVHSLMGKYDFNYQQTFFGEHLLSLPENKGLKVGIVESEKAACVCSEVFPDFILLATGGKNGIRLKEKSTWVCLQGREVILFPDVDAHNDWTKLAELVKSFGIKVSVNNLLASAAPETQYDIADCVIAELKRRRQQRQQEYHKQSRNQHIDIKTSDFKDFE